MPRFTNKVVMITGGGAGIGKAAALKFAAQGAKVMIGNRNERAGQAVVDEIKKAGGAAGFKRTDVANDADIKALIDHTIKTFGGLHVAFNNAGVEGATETLADGTLENYQNIFDINVRGVFLAMKYEIQHMLKHGGGAIINNASIAGLVGFPQHGLYAASKHAVLGLTKTAALEYGKAGIRTNAVSPAAIETDMLDRFTGNTPEERAATQQYMVSMHPIGRLGKPEEIADAVLWLASDESSFVLGQSINVDGGFLAI